MGAAEFRQAAGGDADALDDEIANLRASAKKLDADKCPACGVQMPWSIQKEARTPWWTQQHRPSMPWTARRQTGPQLRAAR